MDYTEQTDRRIESYFNGSLIAKDREAFNLQYKTDIQFKEEVDAFLKTKNTILSYNKLERLNKIDTYYEDYLKKRRQRRVYILLGTIAASVLILLAFSLSTQSTQSMEGMYATVIHIHMEEYIPANVRSSNPAHRFARLYRQKDKEGYKDSLAHALTDYQEALKQSSIKNKDQTYLYMGFCELELGNPEKALFYFEKIEQNVVIAKEWFIGLTYLKLQDKEKAIRQFETIASYKKHDYHDQAIDMLEKLRRLQH